MRATLSWLRARADNVAVGLLIAMFVSFMVQIISRYIFNDSVDWTLEVCLTTWLWVVLWESAFLLRDGDHIRFDLFYLMAGPRLRRVLALGAALALLIGFAVSLPATYGYISFEQIRTSSILHIPLDYVFAIYGVFMVAVIIRYGVRLLMLIRGASPDPIETDTAQ